MNERGLALLQAANAIRALAHDYDLYRNWSDATTLRRAALLVEEMADEPADAASDAEQALLRG